MAGTAHDLGLSAVTGALAGILGVLGGAAPVREPTPVAPSIARPTLVLGLPIATVGLLAVAALVAFKLLK